MRNLIVNFSVTTVMIVTMALALGACAARPAISLIKVPPPTAQVTPPPPAPTPPPAPVAPAPPPPVVAAPPPPPPVAVAPPEPQPRVMREFLPNRNVKPVYFGFDQAVIRPGDAKVLDANAAWLKENPQFVVLIEGHCDERGTEQYNLVLGERRAVATMQYLLKQGITTDRMSLVSYGEEVPACMQRNEACWAQSRRAQFKIREK